MIVANPGYYGFTFTGTAAGQMACTQPAGISSAWALLCSSDAAAPSTWVTPTSDKTHLCADVDCHLNSAGQKLVGDFWFSLVAPQTNIAAAVAPNARTTTVGTAVTGFATILNTGTLAAPRLTGQLNATNLKVKGSSWKLMRANLDASPSRVSVQSGELDPAELTRAQLPSSDRPKPMAAAVPLRHHHRNAHSSGNDLCAASVADLSALVSSDSLLLPSISSLRRTKSR